MCRNAVWWADSQFKEYRRLIFIVEPCIDKISVSSNQLMHIFIKKHIKIT